MLASERHGKIIEALRRSGSVRVSELTSLLGVSDMTVRRDLELLAGDGALRKVHGGAVSTSSRRVLEEPSFATKRMLAQPAKLAIARRAVEFIEPGTAIAVSAGTTTWAMAAHLASVPDLTIVTNSAAMAETLAALGDTTRQTLILTGGVRTPSAALVGPVADLSIRSLHVDQLFIGAYGLSIEGGLTTPNLAEAETNRALMAQARRVIVLADSSKWQQVGLASWGALSDVDTIISDSGLDDVAAEAIEEIGPRAVRVAVAPH